MKFATSVLWIIIYLTLHFGAWPATLETCSLCFTAADFNQVGCSCWKSLVSRNLTGNGAVSALGMEVTPSPGLSGAVAERPAGPQPCSVPVCPFEGCANRAVSFI